MATAILVLPLWASGRGNIGISAQYDTPLDLGGVPSGNKKYDITFSYLFVALSSAMSQTSEGVCAHGHCNIGLAAVDAR